MKSGLNGPHRLTVDGIDDVIVDGGPGVFALGYTDGDGKFRITTIGRDDVDIRKKLCDMVGSNAQFKYSMVETTKEAFEKECELFHRFRPPGNFLHPDRPPGTDWECPHCRNFRRKW